MSDADLRALLTTPDPKARDDLRGVMIRDQADRDAIASRLIRYRDQNGQDWGRHHRLPHDAPGCAPAGRAGARGDRRGGLGPTLGSC
jgi:hypothetical protein